MDRIDLVCSTERLNRVIEYEPADMTLAVEAGMPLARLQEILGEKGQFLPLDPPAGPGSTLGGCLSTGASGPLRAGFGTLRDRLLGVRAVLPDGRIAKAGGRVVKNVAGYALGHLYTGALGSLAVVAELYLKVQPLPAQWLALRIPIPPAPDVDDAVEGALAALFGSELEAAAVEVLEPNMSRALGWPAAWHLALAFAGTPGELRYVREHVGRRLAPALPAAGGTVEETPWPGLHAALLGAHRGGWPGREGQATARVHLLSSQVAGFLKEAVEADPAVPVYGIAHAFNGIIRLHFGPAEERACTALLQALRRRAQGQGGWLILEKAPRAVKEQVGVWDGPHGASAAAGGNGEAPGGPGGASTLMAGLKQAFDPHNILNPGRFFGGL